MKRFSKIVFGVMMILAASVVMPVMAVEGDSMSSENTSSGASKIESADDKSANDGSTDGGSSSDGGAAGKAAYNCDPSSNWLKSGGSNPVSGPAQCAQTYEKREVGSTVTDLVNVFLSVLGIVAVIVIILGGVMYVTSNGEASKVAQAKNIIQYAIIGLIVSLLAWAIVNFVVTSFLGK